MTIRNLATGETVVEDRSDTGRLFSEIDYEQGKVWVYVEHEDDLIADYSFVEPETT